MKLTSKCFLVYKTYNNNNNIIITSASQRLAFEEKTEPVFFENASNLTREFLYDNFNKKILLNFLVNIVILKLM